MHASIGLFLTSVISLVAASPTGVDKRAREPCDIFINDEAQKLSPGCLVLNCENQDVNVNALVALPGWTGRSRVTQADYGDASGSLPDGTMFAQSVAFTSSTTTTFSAMIGLNIGYQQDGISAGLTGTLGYSVAVTESTTNTETITISVDCPNGGIVQYQPLYAAVDGDFQLVGGSGIAPYYVKANYTGSYVTPQTGQGDSQLTNFRVVCN